MDEYLEENVCCDCGHLLRTRHKRCGQCREAREIERMEDAHDVEAMKKASDDDQIDWQVARKRLGL